MNEEKDDNGNVYKYRIGILEDWVKKLDSDIENKIFKKLNALEKDMALMKQIQDENIANRKQIKGLWVGLIGSVVYFIVINFIK